MQNRTVKHGNSIKIGRVDLHLKHFKNIITDSINPCLVCGTGPSISQVKKNDKDVFKIIGVNSIADYLTPHYLVVLDKLYRDAPEHSYPEGQQERIIGIADTGADYAFAPFDIGFKSPFVKTNLATIKPIPDIKAAFQNHKLIACVTSTIAAISLALYMGFRQIGVIGFDVQGHKIESQIGEMNRGCDLLYDYGNKNGMEIVNLSERSLITSFPRITLKQFRGYYGRESK